MTEGKRYYWLRLKNDFFTDKRIKKLRKVAGGDTYTIIYLKMQLLSLQDDGNLYFENLEETFEEEIALQIDEDIEDVKITINFLLNSGLLEQKSTNVYELVETKNCIGSETESAIRTRKCRENKKIKFENVTNLLQCNTDVINCNNDVIKCNTDKDIDIDIDKDKKEKIIKKENNYFIDIELDTIFKEFLQVRKKLKAVNSDRAIKTLINKLSKYDDETKYKMIEQSIVNSWKDVYELKNNNKNNSNNLFLDYVKENENE